MADDTLPREEAQDSEKIIHILLDSLALEGALAVPSGAKGIVLFAHGTGSSRHSPRNNFVAREIRSAGVGTLLFDLLTEEEDVDRQARFDIDLLTERLRLATRWIGENPETSALGVGYFGASTGAAAALKAAAELGPSILAVVSRGGRPDLAEPVLDRVESPTLLIVGERDDEVVELNRQACKRLRGRKELFLVPGATHLFEEPGTLEEVARLATNWFRRYLSAASDSRK
ncbi:MAG: dienelactone hydrolase family protein [Acidobacteriota bacterium]